jgi:hypothetical protein
MRRCFRVRQCAENDPQKRDPRRRGYTLVFFAMLMFALMGLAALVIDLGFARLTQRQMQTAVDSAALEGLRWRDVNEWEEVPQGWLGDPDFITLFDDNEDFIGTITNDVDKDRIRRWAAQQVVLSTFDDDLESGNGDDGAFDGGGQFGAGPVVEFTGGAGDPTLVASQTMSVDPASPVYKPEFMDGTPSASGFQVAMLRGGTGIPDADVYSVGPSLPYLFARGSMINRQLIQDGITVRATGVADARPATAVGVDIPGVVAGAQRFALREATWALLPVDDGDPMTDDSVVVTVDGVNLGSTPMPMRSLGEMIALSPTPEAASGFVAIFDDVQGTNRVIGFGLAAITVESPTEVRITSLCVDGGIIATENATAILGLVSPEVIGLSESEQQELFTRNRDLEDVVYAPGSVR